jgi:hypothetical protein
MLINNNAKLALTTNANPFRPGSNGHAYFVQVILPLLGNGQVATMQQLYNLANTVVIGQMPLLHTHLLWLYARGQLTINGHTSK